MDGIALKRKKNSILLDTCGPLDLSKSFSICSIHFTKNDHIANTGRHNMLIEYKLPMYSNIKSIDKNLLFSRPIIKD